MFSKSDYVFPLFGFVHNRVTRKKKNMASVNLQRPAACYLYGVFFSLHKIKGGCWVPYSMFPIWDTYLVAETFIH